MKNNADGLILGKTKENNLVIQHEKSKISNRNIFVVGGPGSFKTQSYVLPNVINNRSSSIVVTDPKGEIYEMTNAIKQKQGFKTVVVNFKDFLLSSRYNPLLYIRKSSDTNIIANAVVSAKNDPKRKDFWFNAQMSLLNSLIKYVYFEYDPKSRNLEGILDFLEEFDPRYNEDGVSELDEQFERLPDGHEAKRSYYLGFRQAQSEARPNIVISLLTTLLDYIDNDVSEFTNTNDFFFEELGQSKVCLYILISPLDRTWDGLINLYFQQMFTELFLLGDKNNAKLPVPCVMLLDEFVNLGYFATYENFLATCRGYRISVSTILQSIPQLQELYGDKKAKAIIGNHSVRICLGGVEETTAEYFSRLIGDTTIRVNTGSQSQSRVSSKGNQSSGSKSEQYSYQKRRLITEGEVINLQDKENGRKSIVVIEGKPFMLRKTPQFELFDDLLSEHNVSQQDYVSEQSEFAIEYIFNLEKEFKEKKQAVLDSLKSKTKIKEDNQESLEIPLPENEVVPLHDQNSSFEHEEEQKEIEQKIDEEIDSEDLMNDIMQSFDGLSFEEEITQPKIKSENTTTNSNSDDDFPF